ncbi:MAG TPA: OmpA family protein [Bacteroidia bacterium]|jgi:peptidoglycan-associated lipoprotein|nr:OmpA family protein [Bacteroidia bacterium]
MKQFTKLTLIAFALICMASPSFAQKALAKADLAFDNHQYFTAVELYKSAYTGVKKADLKAKVLFRTAFAYQEINDMKSAETYYQKAIAAKYADPEAIVRLADVLKSQGKYPEAITEYQNFKKLAPSDPRGDKGVKSSELAQQWKDNPGRYKIENMALINSKESDFSPSYSDKKYNTLVFTSTREGVNQKQDITTGQNHSKLYETKLDKNGKWSTPLVLAGAVTSVFNDGAACMSKKGDFMLMTRCPEVKSKTSGCQIFMAKKQGSGWAEPVKLPFNLDSVQFGHPALSADGKTVYFVSRMKGGFGGSDIWRTLYDQKANTWSAPQNLGPQINGSGDEMYPYVSDDSKTLYFSSNSHPGMGGLDIFKAEIGADGKFTKAPENLKVPINSGADDFGIVFEGKKQRGYFSSNREGGKGSDDIWSFYLPPLVFNLKGKVVSSGGSKGIGKGEPVANAKIKIQGSDGTINDASTASEGSYAFKLKENVSYTVTVETSKQTSSATYKDGYLASKDMGALTTAGEKDSKDFMKDFEVVPVEKEIRFPAVLYDLGKADLRPESKDSLNFLYQTLIDNPTIVIQLSAHTDSRGSDAKNLVLSQARAQSCVDYLANEKKIPLARLQAKGFGETRLLVKDAEIAKAKTKEEKEALHAKNRRTVFGIVSWDYQDPNAPKNAVPTNKPKVSGEEDDSE